MQVIQLYIEGQRVDMFEDESVNITETIQNIKDIGKVFGDFSQTFSIPASRNNNKIFKHYYNSSINNGFDGRRKVDASIKLNNIDYKVGKIKLEGVDLKNNAPHAYRITFFGGIVNLKDLLGEDKINELPWLANFDMNYNKADIIDALREGKNYTIDSVSYPKALVVPLITPQQRLYYDSSDNAVDTGNLYAEDYVAHGVEWTQLKPSIRIYNIIKAIEKKYNIANGYPSNIVFSNDFFSTTNEKFYELYMWLHRKEGTVFDNLDGLYARNIDVLPLDNLSGFITNNNSFSISDVFSFGAFPYQTTLNVTTLGTNLFNVILLKNGSEVFRENDNTGSTSYAFYFGGLSNGFYEIRIEAKTAVSLNGNLYTERTQGNTGQIIVTDKTFTFTSSFNLLANYVFEILNQVPDIKVIDFLSGLFKMFNLTAYEEDGVVVVKHLDEYYSDGVEYDITKYVDVSESSVNSSRLYKEISFGYQGLGSLQAKKHKELFSYDWGTEEFRGDTSYDGEIYKVQLPFEHLKYERLVDLNTDTNKSLQWGWMVSDLNQTNAYENGSVYLGKPLVFYPVLDVIGDSMRITDNGTYNDIQRYHLPSNSLTLSDSFNINFKAELNEFTNTIFEDTLFQRYYSNYISSIFDFKNRLTKITAYFPLRILSKYKLSDVFKINNKQYLINSIQTDLLSGKSSLELLNVINQTQSGGVIPPTLEDATVSTLSGSSTDNSFTMNGQVTFEGIETYTERGFYWVQDTGSPIGGTKVEVSGTGISPYSATVTGRPSDTTFSYIAYVINNGTIKYGTPALQVTTLEELDTPVVNTVSSTPSLNSAVLYGNITDVGNPNYTVKGFYYRNDNLQPTISDNFISVNSTVGGSYNLTLTGLDSGEEYSFRAFATNTEGTSLSSNYLTLITLAKAAVTTLDATNVSETSARLNGNVTYVGNPNYTSKGFYWKAGTSTPTAADNIAYADVTGTSSGAYYSSISGLNDGATYSFVAWVTNSQGTTTGIKELLTTTAIPLYYSLTRCTDGQTGFRSGQDTSGITLPTNENHRVSANGIFYIVTGTTNNPFNSVGDVTNEFATECPEIPPTEYPPSVTTLSADPVGTSTATMNGNITDVGLPAYTSGNKGFIWILGTGDPLSGGTTVPVSGTGTGIFSHQLTSLSDGQQYTYRAYASNGVAPDPVYGDTSTFITNLISYYELKRCNDDATGFRSQQTVDAFDPILGTNRRVTADGINYVVLNSGTQGTSVGNITDTGVSFCPTDLPRTYTVENCLGGVTSTVNYTSDGALANNSAYFDGNECWEIQTVTVYDANATNIDGTTIYNSCLDCNNANPQLTAFSSTTVKSFNTVCNPAFLSETYYHDGASSLPQVDDVCYTTSNGSTVLPAGYYAINDGFNFIDISNNNGIVDAVGAC
jgi:hypothetical protein